MHDMIIVITSVFNDSNKYYQQTFFDEYFHKQLNRYKCWSMIELTSISEGKMLVKMKIPVSVLFINIITLLTKNVNINHMYVMPVIIYYKNDAAVVTVGKKMITEFIFGT